MAAQAAHRGNRTVFVAEPFISRLGSEHNGLDVHVVRTVHELLTEAFGTSATARPLHSRLPLKLAVQPLAYKPRYTTLLLPLDPLLFRLVGLATPPVKTIPAAAGPPLPSISKAHQEMSLDDGHGWPLG